MKVGRNDLCPCGSGKKFKKCHLAGPLVLPIVGHPEAPKSALPPHLWDRIDERVRTEQLQEQARVAAYGDIRSIIHLDYAGYRLVVVRNRVYYSKKWKFFTDFLFEY